MLVPLPLVSQSLADGVVAWDDPRDRFIRQYADGRSFVDIGGIERDEKVSVAYRAGAKSLVMCDIAPFSKAEWQDFRQAMEAIGAEVECLSADLFTLERAWDVVHSGGVLYHQPNPFTYLAKLRSITLEFCVLTSTVAPSVIKSSVGTLRLPQGGVLLVPALNEDEQAVLKEFMGSAGFDPILSPEEYLLSNYSANWWFPTSAALRRMCECAGFKVASQEDFPPDVYPASTLLLVPDARRQPQ